jgi:hypothetical protein
MGTIVFQSHFGCGGKEKKIRLLGIEHQSEPSKNYRGFDSDSNLKFVFNAGFVEGACGSVVG